MSRIKFVDDGGVLTQIPLTVAEEAERDDEEAAALLPKPPRPLTKLELLEARIEALENRKPI